MLSSAIAVGLAAIAALTALWRLLLVHGELRYEATELENRITQLRLITDSVPLLLIYIDRGQAVRYLNSTAENWFGTVVSGACTFTLARLLGADFYAAIQAQVEQALTGEVSSYGNVPSPPDDDPRHYSVDYVPDVDPRGAVRGVLIVMGDTTDQVRALQDLREAEMRMAELKVIRSTAATYAHEINNPLTGIICGAEMIADGDVVDTECREMARELLDAARRIEEVTSLLAKLENPSYRDYGMGDTQIIDVSKAS